MNRTTLKRRFGFKQIGEFGLPKGKDIPLAFALETVPRRAGVYAFCVDDEVSYIGSSCNLYLRLRDHCRRPGSLSRHLSYLKRRRLIVAALRSGARVRVLICTPPSRFWNGLRISVVAGIEDKLLGLFTPPWATMRGDQGKRALAV